MRTKKLIKLCCAAACALVTTSCINNDYDLKNVDLTLGSQIDLNLPGGSTGSITLASFIMDNNNDYLDSVDLGDGKAKAIYLAVKGSTEFSFKGMKPGKLTPEGGSNPQFDMTINNLPAILSGDNVNLDLQNPIITLFSNSSSENVIALDADITAYKNDADMGTCSVEDISFGQNKTLHYIRECGETTEQVPAAVLKKIDGYDQYTHTTDANVSESSKSTMGGILACVPERVHVELKNLTASGTQVTQETQTVSHTYQLYAPLRIGKNFNLDYNTDVTGWSDSFKDVKELSDSSATLTVTGEISNNSPLDAVITVTPKDVNGSSMEKYITVYKSDLIQAGKSDNKLIYELKSLDSRYSITDYMMGRKGAPQLDGIDVLCTLTNSTSDEIDTYLRTDAAVVMKNVKMAIKGTIIYDAN